MRKLVFILFVAILFFGCSERRDVDSRPIIVVSIEPYRYFVNNIAGERFRVVTLVSANSSPEGYEPLPGQIIDLVNSRAYFASGYIDFERTHLKQILNETPSFPLFDLSKGIKTLKDADGEGIDPHIWLSPRNVMTIGENICAALCVLDSLNADEYKRQTADFIRHVDSIDKRIQQITAPLVSRSFLIYHPALTYFAADYGLRQLPVMTGGKEASPAHIRKLLEQNCIEQAAVFFVQKQFPTTSVKQLSEETKTRVVEIDPLAYSWDKELLTIAESLAK